MNDSQRNLLRDIHQASFSRDSEILTYHSEWLGYLPYGQYHWLSMAGKDLEVEHPDSLLKDLEILVELGWLVEIERFELDEDLKIVYELFRK